MFWLILFITCILVFCIWWIVVLTDTPEIFTRSYWVKRKNCQVKAKYFEYVTSKDYERLYELLNGGARVCGVFGSPGFGRYLTLHKAGSRSRSEILYNMGDDDYVCLSSKERFIGYCSYKDIRYLDYIEDKK